MSAPEGDSASHDELGRVYRKRSVSSSKGGSSPKGRRTSSISAEPGEHPNDYIASLKQKTSGGKTSASRESELGGSSGRRSARSASLAGPPPTRPPPAAPSRSSSGESIESRTEDETPFPVAVRKSRARSPRDDMTRRDSYPDSYPNDAPSLSPKGHREHSPPPDKVSAPADLPLVVVQDCSRKLSKKTSQEFKFSINSVQIRDIEVDSQISEESDRSNELVLNTAPVNIHPSLIHPSLIKPQAGSVPHPSILPDDSIMASPKRETSPRILPLTPATKAPSAFIRSSDSLEARKKPKWKYVPGISFFPDHTEPFLCDITQCGNRFTDESSVMTHLRSSHEVYHLYACACTSRFAMKYSLNLHLGKCTYESDCSSTETEGDTSEPSGRSTGSLVLDIPAFQGGAVSSDGSTTPPGTPDGSGSRTPKKRKKREISLPLSGSRESLPIPHGASVSDPPSSGSESDRKRGTPRNGKSPRRTKSEDATPGQGSSRKKKTSEGSKRVEDLIRKNTASGGPPGLTQLDERASEESK